MGLTRALAEFAAGATVPPQTAHEGVRSIINCLAAAVGAPSHPAVEIACRACAGWGSAPQARVIGRPERLSVADAAWVNGLLAHVLDFDDTHPATIIHVSSPVLPAVLALAETHGSSGAALVEAFVLGAEVALRLGEAVFPSHYDVGHHITGTVCAVGAAAGAGRLLGLDPPRLQHALGIASARAAGFRVQFGAMTKSLTVGNAAHTGTVAALLAAEGFTAAPDSLEGTYGLLRVTSSEPRLERATDGLGERWLLLENTYKPFPCGIVAHPTLDGALRARRRHEIDWRQVEAVELEVNPRALDLTGKREPATGLEGKFSIYHCAAVALVEGRGGEAQFSDAAVNDPRVVELRHRVRAQADPALDQTQARVAVTLKDGRRLEERVEHCLGSASQPMSDADLERKFRDQAGPAWPPQRLDELLRRLWDLPGQTDLRPCLDLLAP